MLRKAFVMAVHPQSVGEYTRRHNPIPADLEAVLKAHGVHNYSLFLHPQTHQLFGYVEVDSDTQWDAIAATDPCRRWWDFMQDVMPTHPDHSPVSLALTEVFHLE